MNRKDKKKVLWSVLGVLVLLVVIAAAVLLVVQNTSLGSEPHEVLVFNQTWLLSSGQPWGVSYSGCVLGGHGSGGANYVSSDLTNATIHLVLTTPNSRGNYCVFGTSAGVVLESVDWRNYSGVIHRQLVLSVNGGGRSSYHSDVFSGLLTNEVGDPGVNSFSFSKSFGDVYVTNQGATLLIRSDENPQGKLLPIGSDPIIFSGRASIGTGASGSSDGVIDYSITGVDLVPVVTQAPVVVPMVVYQPPPQPVVYQTPAPVVIPVVVLPNVTPVVQAPAPVSSSLLPWVIGIIAFAVVATITILLLTRKKTRKRGR